MATSTRPYRKGSPFPFLGEQTVTFPTTPGGPSSPSASGDAQPHLEHPQPILGQFASFFDIPNVTTEAIGYDFDGLHVAEEKSYWSDNSSSCESTGTSFRGTPEVDSCSPRPPFQPPMTLSYIIGIRCRNTGGVMQYQTMREVVSFRPHYPVLWDTLEDGVPMTSPATFTRQEDEWLVFGTARFPEPIAEYLQRRGFSGLFSSIIEGAEFPFPVQEGTWSI